MGGMCFDNKPCDGHQDCNTCNECYLIADCDIQFHGAPKNITFSRRAFCEYLACEDHCPCPTTHYFFLGTICKCGCGKLEYDEADIYYLKNISDTYFLYYHKDNKKVTKKYWCSEGKPGTWSTIYMICADPVGRGLP